MKLIKIFKKDPVFSIWELNGPSCRNFHPRMLCDKFGYIDQVVLERTLSRSLSQFFFNKLASSNVSFNKYYANAEDVLLFHLGTIGG